MSAEARESRDRPPERPRSSFASSFSLVHVAGIDIRVHFTFFVLVALFALASTGPGGPGVVGGLVWLVVIFACVVVHELAHSLVARRRGAVVREIVLLPIGGVSKLENLPETPADEFAIAVVGPVASLGLAALCAALALVLRQALLPVDLYGGPFLVRLAWFNVLVGAFNLLPAFPLDGGRVFRAMLERRYDLERATHIAARVGRVLAVSLVAVGVLVNLWLLLIGVFVYVGASAEEAATTIHIRLAGRPVGEIMLHDPLILDPGMSAAELATLSRRTAQRVFPVVGPSGYVGLLRLGAVPYEPARLVADLADRTTPVLSPAASAEQDALPLIVSSPSRAVAVADDGHIVGLLCIEDVEHLLADSS